MQLGLLLFVAGLTGAVAGVLFIVPAQLRTLETKPPAPMPVILLASVAQSAVLLALAVWAGVALGAETGLQAPAFSALVQGGSVGDALRPQWVPGLAGGVFGGLVLILFARFLPPALAEAQARLKLPLGVRVLYGGITEELLMRWGLMTLITWAGWRLVQGGEGVPSSAVAWLAISISALVFAVGHLPAVAALGGAMSRQVVGYVVGANGVFGLMAGFLFWRYGLEAAILAHSLAHVLAWVPEKLGFPGRRPMPAA